MHRSLRLVHPEKVPSSLGDARVGVRFSLLGDSLQAEFEVHAAGLHFNPDLPKEGSQWGLWDWDVVEVFVTAGGPSYFEFQVSPLSQSFELEIFEPRKRFDREFRCGWKRKSSYEETGDGIVWTARLSLPLKELGWNGDPSSIRGGAFAILGASGERGYWSLFLPPQSKPDFHLPAEFRPLLDQG